MFFIAKMKVGVAYFGNSFIQCKIHLKEFVKLKDQVDVRLGGWNGQFLSKAGKATLIKSVVQAITNHVMSIQQR